MKGGGERGKGGGGGGGGTEPKTEKKKLIFLKQQRCTEVEGTKKGEETHCKTYGNWEVTFYI